MSGPIVLDLPLPPNVANTSWHWAVKRRAKKRYEERAYYAAREQHRPALPTGKVRVSLHFRTWNPLDEDNLVARAKWPIDALKGAWLTDDSPAHMELGDVTQEVERSDRGVTVTIEPMD